MTENFPERLKVIVLESNAFRRQKMIEPKFLEIFDQTTEEVIKKAEELYNLAKESPRALKAIHESHISDATKFLEDADKNRKNFDPLKKAYVELFDFRRSKKSDYEQKYGVSFCCGIANAAQKADSFILELIEKQLKPQKHVTFRDDNLGEIHKIPAENKGRKWSDRIKDKQSNQKSSSQSPDAS